MGTAREEQIYRVKEFARLCDSLPDIVWCLNNKARIEYLNKSCKKLIGSSVSPGMNMLDFAAVVHPSDKERFQSHWRESFKQNKEFCAYAKLKEKQGYSWHICRVFPIADSCGEVEMWYGSFMRIQSIKKESEDLRRALALKDQFISMVTHELRSPLTTIGMALELIKMVVKDAKPEDHERLCHLIKTKVDMAFNSFSRLSFMVDELVDVSKSLKTGFSLNIQAIDFSQVLDHVLERIAPNLEKNKIQINVKKDERVKGHWDEFRLEQILSNLLSNAIKYGEGRPIDIELRDEKNKNKALLKIKDRGAGILPEDQDRIFEKFQRSSKQKQVESMGLGLYITKSLVKAHSGEIWLESSPGKGATFIVELPKQRKIEAAEALHGP
ncbi:MAG: PAS domain-containing sensor histidine kinase [Bacteriovoracaceae bacterium]